MKYPLLAFKFFMNRSTFFPVSIQCRVTKWPQSGSLRIFTVIFSVSFRSFKTGGQNSPLVMRNSTLLSDSVIMSGFQELTCDILRKSNGTRYLKSGSFDLVTNNYSSRAFGPWNSIFPSMSQFSRHNHCILLPQRGTMGCCQGITWDLLYHRWLISGILNIPIPQNEYHNGTFMNKTEYISMIDIITLSLF